MSWHEIPFVRLLIPFALGITCSLYWQIIPLQNAFIAVAITFIILLVLGVLKTNFRYRWLFGIPLSILLFLGGYLLTALNNDINYSTHFKHLIADHKETLFTGVVTDKTERQNHHRLTIAINGIISEKKDWQAATGNILIYLKKDSLKVPPQYGDVILSRAKIQELEPPKNPDAFDFKHYWHLQNIHYQGFINFDAIKTVASDEGNPIISIALKCQSHLVGLLKNAFGKGDEWAVGSALLLGNKEAISDEIRNAYIETGAMHILAISGMHILLIFQMLEKVLNLYKSGYRQWRWIRLCILITATILFSLLVGMGASVLRAAVMASFLALSKTIWRQVNILNILAASAMVLLLYNPLWLFDIGFQLSYIAVAGIAYFAPFLQKILPIENKYLNWVWKNISVGLAAQLAVTPIALYYFHQFPVWFWLTGLLVGVVADAALVVGILYFATHFIPVLGIIISKILFGLLWVMNTLVFFVDKLPYNLIDSFWLPLWLVVAFYLVLFFFTKGIVLRQLRPINTALLGVIFITLIYGFSDITKKPTKRIIAYYLPQNTLIDIIHGDSCTSFSKKFSENFNLENKIKFAAANHRKALKIKTLNKFIFDKYVINDYLIYHPNVIRFEGQIILLLDKLPVNKVNLYVNTVILRDNPRFDIQELLPLITFDNLVFDGSNSRKKVLKWVEECKNLGINYHDIAEKGAWIQNF